MKKKKPSVRHDCRLNPIDLEHELPCTPPYASGPEKWLSNFLMNWMTASRSNRNSYKYLRSSCALYKEKRRQLTNHEYRMIIHPLSRFTMVHHTGALLLWSVAFVLDPLMGTFLSPILTGSHRNHYVEMLQLLLNFLFTFNVLVNFFEGYVDQRTGHVVLAQAKIARRYLSTYFFFDAVPIAYNCACFVLRGHSFEETVAMAHLYCLRFVRLFTMLQYLSELMGHFGVNESVTKCVSICLAQMVIVHWWACLFYLAPVVCYRYELSAADSWVVKTAIGTSRPLHAVYVECLLCVVCHYFGAGVGNIMKAEHPAEMLVLGATIMCGCGVQIYVIATILLLFGTLKVSEIKYDQFMHQLKQYMVTKKFPRRLRERLRTYYDYRFQKQFFHENLILSGLSEHLRLEVLLYSCKNLIDRLVLLQDAPKEVIGALVVRLQQEVYLPGDVIIKSDGYNEFIYFISFGTISMHLPNGKEILHLEDGHHFGDTKMFVKEPYHPSVLAVEITEVFYLDKASFCQIATEHQDLMERLNDNANFKFGLYTTMMETDESPLDSGDILHELRKGKILESAHKRTPVQVWYQSGY